MTMETKEKALILSGKFKNKILDIVGYSLSWKGKKCSSKCSRAYVYVTAPKEVGSYELCYRYGSVRIGTEKEDVSKNISKKTKEIKNKLFIVTSCAHTYKSLELAEKAARQRIGTLYSGTLEVQISEVIKVVKKKCEIVVESV
jgi:hypothetical protein